MSSRSRNHYPPPSNRSKSRSSRYRRVNDYQDTPRSDYHNGYNQRLDSRSYSLDSPSDQDFEASYDGSESKETSSLCDDMISPDEAVDRDDRFRDYSSKNRDRLAQYYSSRRSNDYDSVSLRTTVSPPRRASFGPDKIQQDSPVDHHANLAMQKLQQLRELQRRRDYTEKYYSHKIKELIGDQAYEAKANQPNSGLIRSQAPSYVGDRLPSARTSYAGNRLPTAVSNNTNDRLSPNTLDSLEPCGTMTTVTRLNCGCVEQTTRPIFTTASGQQIQRRNCAQDQRVHVRLSTPNTRLVLGAGHRQTPVNSFGLKSRSFAEAQRGPAPVQTTNGLTSNGNKMGDVQGAGVKTGSPTRKISESSVYSYSA